MLLGHGREKLHQLKFEFDGREALHHVVDARQLGASLIGLDKAVSTSLVILIHGRMPKGRERIADLYVAAKAPEKGSVTIIENVPWILPLVGEVIKTYGADFIRNFLSWMLLWHGGRKSDAQVYMDAMTEVLKENNRSHEATTEAWQRTLLAVVEQLAPAAKQMVEPVGRTASELRIGDASGGQTVIDEPTAEAIRSREEIELTDKETLVVTVDGVIKRSKALRLVLEDGAYQAAEIRDPEFDVTPNIYLDALSAGFPIKITARRALRAGKLYRLYVLEAEKA